MTKLVCVISPFRATTERSQAEHGAFAQRLCRLASLAGYVPFASHLFAPSFLDENDPKERAAGIEISKAIIERSDQVWVWDAWGISSGMAAEIAYAEKMLVVRYFFSRGEILAWAGLRFAG